MKPRPAGKTAIAQKLTAYVRNRALRRSIVRDTVMNLFMTSAGQQDFTSVLATVRLVRPRASAASVRYALRTLVDAGVLTPARSGTRWELARLTVE